MSDVPDCRLYALQGPDAERALDWLYVHGDVHGVLEEAQAVVVWMPGAMPALPSELDVTVVERLVRPEDFHVTGLENDVAIQVAADLLVRPPWVLQPPGFTGVELVVPRGGAFGSGEHESTKAALVVMHRGWSDPDSMADVGTGSGILALYAQVRGCRRIEACDIDEPSVIAARELLPAANVHVGGAMLMAPCDLVVANMKGVELTDALHEILAVWTRRHELVLSGMRAHEVDALVAAVPARVRDTETLGSFTAVRFAGDADVA